MFVRRSVLPSCSLCVVIFGLPRLSHLSAFASCDPVLACWLLRIWGACLIELLARVLLFCGSHVYDLTWTFSNVGRVAVYETALLISLYHFERLREVLVFLYDLCPFLPIAGRTRERERESERLLRANKTGENASHHSRRAMLEMYAPLLGSFIC